MEKVDVLGLAIIVLGIFTFINIVAIRTLFIAIEILRNSLSDAVHTMINTICDQHETNKKQIDFISELARQVGVSAEVITSILNIMQRSNNHNSPTGGQETSN